MLGEKLLKLRKKQGLSQQEVADELSLTRQTISNWECDQGAPSIDKARELAVLYHVSLDDLVGNDVEIVSVESHKNSHILQSLVGKTCKISCEDMSLLIESPVKGLVKILDVNSDWVKIEYLRRKDNLISKERVVKLVDIDIVNGFEIVGDKL